MSVKSLLDEEIQKELGELSKISVGTEEYKTAVDGITKLMVQSNDLKRLDIDMEDKIENREIETDLRLQQMDDERKDRLVKNCLAVAGIVIPSVITVWGTLKSLKFEEEGTVTTIMGRGFINKLLPKK